jgi:capsular polysaccharide transport system permease protein
MNVIMALLLRDIRVRAGRYYVGYLVIFLMPFVHLTAVLAVFVALGRVPWVGTDSTIFFGISILPFVIYVYPSRQIVVALAANRPLLSFPRVKIVDIITARAILETVNGVAVSGVVFIVLFAVTLHFSPRDPFGMICAILLTLYFGVAYGFVNALIAHVFHFWNYAFNIQFPLIWITCGIIFNPHAIPSPYKEYLAYFPLLHCVEYIRFSYYEGYPDQILNVSFVFWTATGILALGMISERVGRRMMLSS